MSYVTLPTPVFLLVLTGVAVAAALLAAGAAAFALRVRESRVAAYRRRVSGADVPFTPGALQDLHRRAADLAAREAVRSGQATRADR